MLKPYDILTKCQNKLKECNLPIIDKLQIEMYILRSKRRLLDDNFGMKTYSATKREKEYKDLYDQVCNLCEPEGKGGDAKDIIIRLQNLMKDVKKPLETPEES